MAMIKAIKYGANKIIVRYNVILNCILLFFSGKNLSPEDEKKISTNHENLCNMTNVGQIVPRLVSRNIIQRKRMEQLNRYLKDKGSFVAAS